MSAGYWGDAVPEETLSRDEAQRLFKRLFRMLRPQRGAITVAAIVLMLQAAALLAGPALVAYGIDHGIEAHDPGALNLAVRRLPRHGGRGPDPRPVGDHPRRAYR